MSKPPRLTRREFVQLGAASAVGLSLGGRAVGASEGRRLARVTEAEALLRLRPDPGSGLVRPAPFDEVIEIGREVVGRGVYPHNHVWFETAEGYLWSADAQPVLDRPNPAATEIPAAGVWTEISVPYVDGLRAPDPASPVRYRLYYAMVLNVNAVTAGADGLPWYRVEDENGVVLFAHAAAFRILPPEELAPIITPGAEKSIRVNLERQDLSAFEDGVEVYYCRIASGYSFTRQGRRIWNTPIGQNWTWRKMVSRHMSGGDLVSGYDLPGVGWTILFSGMGAAVHSTYWHNDYGTPRSRGCINVTPEDARWLFRWSNPPVDYRPGDVTSLFPTPGTPVIVRET